MRKIAAIVSLHIFVLSCHGLYAQVITTIAGLGAAGYGGDGGPASVAQTNYAYGTATDRYGNLFIADTDNHRVRKINAAGIITTVAGNGTIGYSGDGGPATAAQLGYPKRLVVDSAGNILFTDIYYHVVRRIGASGIITTFAGSGLSTVGGYGGDGGPATAAQLYGPFGIAADRMGNVYIADASNHRVRKVDAFGIITTVIGTGVSGMAGNGGPASLAQAGLPKGVCVDTAGNVYIGEQDNNCVRKIDVVTGLVQVVAGIPGVPSGFSGDGGPATSALLRLPLSVAVDTAGNLFLGDYFNHRIRKVNPAGIISTVAGTGIMGFSGDGGAPTVAQLNLPVDVCATDAGCVYIADVGNQRVRRIAPVNSAPYFTGGALQYKVYCPSEAFDLDTTLAVMDTNSGQAITWSLFSPPAHGVASIVYSTLSSGGVLIPSGLSYIPTAGYSGPDTFTVRVTDGIESGFTVVALTVGITPVAAPIIGADTICVGDVDTFNAPGVGIWTSSNPAVATITGGVCSGVAVGSATVTYTVSNVCGVATATHTVTVRPAGTCFVGLPDVAGDDVVTIFPNPNAGSFSIRWPLTTDLHVIITDATGRLVKDFFSRGTSEVYLDLGSGIYFMDARNEHHRYYQKIAVLR